MLTAGWSSATSAIGRCSPRFGRTAGTRPIYSGEASFGFPRRHLLEGETGPAEHPGPDFLWLERSNAEVKISVFGVVIPSFSCPGQSLLF